MRATFLALLIVSGCSSGSEEGRTTPEVERRMAARSEQDEGTARSRGLDDGFPRETRLEDIRREVGGARARHAARPEAPEGREATESVLASMADEMAAELGIRRDRFDALSAQLQDDSPGVRCEARHRLQHRDEAPSPAMVREWEASGCEHDSLETSRCRAEPTSSPDCARRLREHEATLRRQQALARQTQQNLDGTGLPSSPPIEDLEVRDSLMESFRTR